MTRIDPLTGTVIKEPTPPAPAPQPAPAMLATLKAGQEYTFTGTLGDAAAKSAELAEEEARARYLITLSDRAAEVYRDMVRVAAAALASYDETGEHDLTARRFEVADGAFAIWLANTI